jgi:hypothetical protein
MSILYLGLLSYYIFSFELWRISRYISGFD